MSEQTSIRVVVTRYYDPEEIFPGWIEYPRMRSGTVNAPDPIPASEVVEFVKKDLYLFFDEAEWDIEIVEKP